MRNIYILALSLFASTFTFAQTDQISQEYNYIGNYDISNFNENNNYFQDHYLLGIKFTVEEKSELLSLNLLGNNTGANVYMALYTDNNGVPADLVAVSERGVVDMQDEILSLAVTPTEIEAGDYWIMAVYDEDGTHTYITTDRPDNQIYYKSLNYGDAPFENASDFTMYTGRTYSYFLNAVPVDEEIVIVEEEEVIEFAEEIEEEEAAEEVEESTADRIAIEEEVIAELPEINLYPNPTSDILNISNLEKDVNIIEMYDISGQRIRLENASVGTHQTDVSDLPTGTYFIRVNGEITKKFVKA